MCRCALCVVCWAPVQWPVPSPRLAGSIHVCLVDSLPLPQGPRHGPSGPRSGLDEAFPGLGVGEPHFLCHPATTCRMNSVLMSCGPASPRWATRRDGKVIAANHCSRTAEYHSWPCTREARGPT